MDIRNIVYGHAFIGMSCIIDVFFLCVIDGRGVRCC